MMRLIMKETDEYERLVKFFVENELEFDGDEEVDTDLSLIHIYRGKIYRIFQRKNGPD